ncbi:AraC family transcriptional regulator [Flavitalea flava]
MKPLTPSSFNQKTDTPYRFSEKLPIGFTITCLQETADQLDITLPSAGQDGFVMTFVNYKGDLQIAIGERRDELQPLSPGQGLLSLGSLPMSFRSFSPVHFSAITLFITRDWINLFMKDNGNFSKIEQLLEKDSTVVTCRLGRRQLSLFSMILTHKGQNAGQQAGNLLEIQNHALCLLEYFLCNRHQTLPGVHTSSSIDNEEDLSLIREVESYISEFYCSDTFTVDSILKKTYTSYHKLNFLFKSIHGMTISEYIRNKRIEKSKEMIADKVKSISQIAYEIGYSSISNYILAFKKIYQMTPGKYKKQMEA